jgi:hypothetical protein
VRYRVEFEPEQSLNPLQKAGGKIMRRRPIVALCAALILPQLALADLPLSREALGRAEAIVAFCSRIIPEQAQQYAQPGKALVAGVPKEELSDARKSQEYEDAFQATTADLEKVDATQAKSACRESLKSDK